jgi:hypothetical protein
VVQKQFPSRSKTGSSFFGPKVVRNGPRFGRSKTGAPILGTKSCPNWVPFLVQNAAPKSGPNISVQNGVPVLETKSGPKGAPFRSKTGRPFYGPTKSYPKTVPMSVQSGSLILGIKSEGSHFGPKRGAHHRDQKLYKKGSHFGLKRGAHSGDQKWSRKGSNSVQNRAPIPGIKSSQKRCLIFV